jgi:hypothetical protein
MIRRKRVKGQLKPLRIKVDIGTEGAYLWAPFGDHMKAGLVSLIPVVILAVVAASGYLPGDPSFSDRVFGGLGSVGNTVSTFGWLLIAAVGLYCAAWAAMSIALVYLMRHRPSFYLHLAAHAVAGGIFLVLFAMGFLALARRDELVGIPVWELEGFLPDIAAAFAIGLTGAAAGAWALKGFLFWYISQERAPLKDVFTFVEGKRRKDEFERL